MPGDDIKKKPKTSGCEMSGNSGGGKATTNIKTNKTSSGTAEPKTQKQQNRNQKHFGKCISKDFSSSSISNEDGGSGAIGLAIQKHHQQQQQQQCSTKQNTTRGGLRVYKIVMLGDGGVGKSAVTLQFVSHSFLDYHDPTIEDSYQQQAVIDGEAALLDILDTAGQVEFTAMRDQYMRCGEGFIICYSVTDRHSFQEASEYRKLITRVRLSEDIPLVLIANKLDLQSQRRVSTEEGKHLAQQFGCPFYETSAALRHYIDDAFYTLIREIRRKEAQKALSNGSSLEKIHSRRRSRWWRVRSIFALVFRRKRRQY